MRTVGITERIGELATDDTERRIPRNALAGSRTAPLVVLVALVLLLAGACAHSGTGAGEGTRDREPGAIETREEAGTGQDLQCRLVKLLGMSRADLLAAIGPADAIVELSPDLDEQERTHIWLGPLTIALDDAGHVVAIHNRTDNWVLRDERNK